MKSFFEGPPSSPVPTPDTSKRRIERPSRRNTFLAGIAALATTLAAEQADAQHHQHRRDQYGQHEEGRRRHRNNRHEESPIEIERLRAELQRLQTHVQQLEQEQPNANEPDSSDQAQENAPTTTETAIARTHPEYLNAPLVVLTPGYHDQSHRPDRYFDRRATFGRLMVAEPILRGDAANVAPTTYEYLARQVAQNGNTQLGRAILRYRNAIPFAVQNRNRNTLRWQISDEDYDARPTTWTAVTSIEDMCLSFEAVARNPSTPEQQATLANALNEGFESDRINPSEATRTLASGLFDDQARMYERQADRHEDQLIDLHRGFTPDEITILRLYVRHLADSGFWRERESGDLTEEQVAEFNQAQVTTNGRISYRLASHLFHFITSHHGRVPHIDNLNWAPALQRDNGSAAITPEYVAADFGVKLAQVLAAASAPLGYEPAQRQEY